MQRLTPGSALEEQLNSTIEPNQGTINSIKQQTTAQSRNSQGENYTPTNTGKTQAGKTTHTLQGENYTHTNTVYKQKARPTPPFCTEDVA